MLRRRGVVHSDDEDTSVPPSRHSITSDARPSISRPAPPSTSNLPSVAKLQPGHIAEIRLLDGNTNTLTAKIASAMGIISEVAVAVEGLGVSTENTEVINWLLG